MTINLTSGPRVVAALVAASAVAVGGAAVVHAQQPSGPPNALQGFSRNRDKPVKINAAELEVHDKDKMAVFSGDVHLVQGDTDMRSSKLVVYYDDQPPPPAPSPKSGKGAQASAQITPQQNQRIKRVEAKGGVRVMQRSQNQIANGDEGIFDMRSNTVTIQGHVLISQGPQVLKGDRLTVNMNTGDSAMTCDTPKGQAPCRVTGLFDPSAMKQGAGGGGLPVLGRKP